MVTTKEKATGILKVLGPAGPQEFLWNGIPEEREVAKNEFEARMRSGQYMATVVDGPKSQTMIRSFEEAEAVEKERGLVEVRISPALVGG